MPALTAAFHQTIYIAVAFAATTVMVASSTGVAQGSGGSGESGNDFAQRLEVAEQQIQDLQESLLSANGGDQFEQPEPSIAVQDLTEKEATKPSTLQINGRIHLDYWNFADESPGIRYFEHPQPTSPNYGTDVEDRLFFRRIRLSFQGNLWESMVYRMQVDFNTPDSGEIKDVYIGFEDVPFHNKILIGNQKRPIGLDHLNSSRFNIFIERPLVVEAFNEDARRIGIAAYNHNEDSSIIWTYGLYALQNPNRTGRVIGDSGQWSGNLRVAGSPWYDERSEGREYVHLGLSGMVAKPDGDAFLSDGNVNESRFWTRSEVRSNSRWLSTGRIAMADWYETLGLEMIANFGPLQIVGEYQSNWTQRESSDLQSRPDLNFQGGYVYIAYMLTGEHVPYKRSSGTIDRVKPFTNLIGRSASNRPGWGALQVAVRYSYLDLTDHDIRGGIGENITGGIVWYFSPNASLQFNAIYGEIDNHEPIEDLSDGHFVALGARLRANF